MQGWKMKDGKIRHQTATARWIMRDWKIRDQYAREENAGQSSMESLFANKCAEANVRMQKMTLVFHHSTLSYIALFVLYLLMCFLCLISAVYMDLFLRILTNVVV